MLFSFVNCIAFSRAAERTHPHDKTIYPRKNDGAQPFSKYYKSLSDQELSAIADRIDALIKENAQLCVPISYAHLCNLFSALAIHQLDLGNGMDAQASRARILRIMKDYLIPRKKTFQRLFQIPGAFSLGKRLIPRLMMKGNGHGWHTEPVDCGKNAIGFVTQRSASLRP